MHPGNTLEACQSVAARTHNSFVTTLTVHVQCCNLTANTHTQTMFTSRIAYVIFLSGIATEGCTWHACRPCWSTKQGFITLYISYMVLIVYILNALSLGKGDGQHMHA